MSNALTNMPRNSFKIIPIGRSDYSDGEEFATNIPTKKRFALTDRSNLNCLRGLF